MLSFGSWCVVALVASIVAWLIYRDWSIRQAIARRTARRHQVKRDWFAVNFVRRVHRKRRLSDQSHRRVDIVGRIRRDAESQSDF